MILKRIAEFLLVLALIFLGSRYIIRTLPGDPLDTILAETGIQLPREILQQQLGLDQPFLRSALNDLLNILQGNWGVSILSQEPINALLAERTLRSCLLVGLTIFILIPFALVLGVFCAVPTKNALLNQMKKGVHIYCAFSSALPMPWLGPLAIYSFCVLLPLFSLTENLFLPALTLAFSQGGPWIRLVSQRVSESLILGCTTGARARGLPEWRVLIFYSFMPVSGAIIAFFSIRIGVLMSSAVVTEVIFNHPKLGLLLVDSTLSRDYPVAQASIFIAALLTMTGNAFRDVLKVWIDPREVAR